LRGSKGEMFQAHIDRQTQCSAAVRRANLAGAFDEVSAVTDALDLLSISRTRYTCTHAASLAASLAATASTEAVNLVIGADGVYRHGFMADQQIMAFRCPFSTKVPNRSD